MTNFRLLLERTRGCSLLIVEDHDQLRNDIAEVLEGLFGVVETAADGIEGLKRYDAFAQEHQRTFDVVIADIRMPGMDGIELCKHIRERNEEQQIIVLSAYTDSEYLLELINLGIAQFINKPVDQENMLNALSTVCGKAGRDEKELTRTDTVDLGENMVWDTRKHALMQDGVAVHLSANEMCLMRLLIEKNGQVCTVDDIVYTSESEGTDLSEKSIRNLVSRLRKKLPPGRIESIYGLGYKLNLPQR